MTIRNWQEITASSAAEALRWIVENEHHEGYARPEINPEGLVLVGNEQQLFIPRGMTEGLMQPSDWDETQRMFEPTESGRKLLMSMKAGRFKGFDEFHRP